ncbi:fimbria/pilus outer membrane usher protein [Parasphingorhabdus sp.]|uniref:fimbria/pilus outer membrane usher protein n=1 Tax=Parasphingorhabdus sp. TaxID=2709688 RepID=UPI00300371C0
MVAGVIRFAMAAAMLGFPGIVIASEQVAIADNLEPSQERSHAITMSVPLVWNGQVLRDVIVNVYSDQTVAIESSSLQTELARLLTEAGITRLNEAINGAPFISQPALKAAGFDVEFEIGRLELIVRSIDPTLRAIQALSGRQTNRDPQLPSIEPARFSAYLNSNVNLIYRDRDGLAPPDVYLSGAARFKDVVLEFEGGFTQSFNDDYRFYRRAVRAVYDEPDEFRRWSAGDLQLNTTGFIQTPFIGGVALEKSRRTFDPFTSTANFGGRQIFVATPSTVEVIVNGAPYQTLDLQPGTYSLDDLPIRIGSNDVRLLIRDAAGREQITRFDYFFDPIDLLAGEDEYTVAAGLMTTNLNLEPSYSGDPVFIGYYRKALSDTLLVGGGIQLSEDVQVISGEMRVVPQVVPGSFDLQGAISNADGAGFAIRGSYRLTIGDSTSAKQVTASVNYESKNFTTVSELSGFSLETLSVNATYSQALSLRTSLIAGVNYFSRSGLRDRSTFFADVNHRLSNNIRATFGAEYGTGSASGQTFGVRVGISVLFGGGHRADATYQSRNKSARASLSRGAGNDVGSLGYSVTLQDTSGASSIDGVVDYIANRFEARASLGSTGTSLGGITNNQTARLQIGTSFAFADGDFGIGRPIQNSFLLAGPHKTLRGTDVIAGRSLSDGKYEASSGVFGSAVINQLSAYNSQDIQYDIDTLEPGYDIGAGVAHVTPDYRSGYTLEVGTDRFVSAVGFLQIGGEPASLVAGQITSEDDDGFEPEPFFTNSAGRFGLIGLAPGRSYTVRLNNSQGTFTIKIPEDNTGLYRVETINLQNETE